jgi:hypothetical protein
VDWAATAAQSGRGARLRPPRGRALAAALGGRIEVVAAGDVDEVEELATDRLHRRTKLSGGAAEVIVLAVTL